MKNIFLSTAWLAVAFLLLGLTSFNVLRVIFLASDGRWTYAVGMLLLAIATALGARFSFGKVNFFEPELEA